MLGLIIAFIASYVITLLIIRSKGLHSQITGDIDFSAPQKIHKSIIPRIGGISIITGIFFALILQKRDDLINGIGGLIFLSCIPVFAIGLTEDLTKKISIRQRLVITIFSATLAIKLLDINISHLDIGYLDFVFNIPGFGLIFAIFAITGLTNSYNIIDGFNGLSSMVALLTMLSLGYVSFLTSDFLLLYLSLAMAMAIGGFFIWNYPSGQVFLGDGGAYLIGFWTAILSILITVRHENVSPWFALSINGYPIFETLFSMYRRKYHQKKSIGQPDAVHLHTLIYRRIVLKKLQFTFTEADLNSKTAPYLWILAAFSSIPGVLYWNNTPVLIIFNFLFCLSYIQLYRMIVRFKIPKYLN